MSSAQRNPKPGPLTDIVVVALEQAVAAPFATRQLADLGATVIKVERPDGGDFARYYDNAAAEGMSSWFVWLNRSKRSVALDIKSDTGMQTLLDLLESADVFIQNLSPAAARRAGLDAETVSARYPHLIVCTVSGFGDGADVDRKAYDLLIQAEAGLLSITGTEEAPAKAGISIADIAAGMYAYSAILVALLQRHKTGKGSVVRVALFDALVEWMAHPIYLQTLTGKAPSRSGARHATIAPYGPYTTADGDDVLIAIQNDREWKRFCEAVLDDADLVADVRFTTNEVRARNRDALEDIVASRLVRLPREQLLDRLDKADIAAATLKSVAQVAADPRLASKWTPVHAGDLEVKVLTPPVRHSDFEFVIGDVPRLGEHDREFGRGLGDGSASVT
jgi:itaconate CoA-transferase